MDRLSHVFVFMYLSRVSEWYTNTYDRIILQAGALLNFPTIPVALHTQRIVEGKM